MTYNYQLVMWKNPFEQVDNNEEVKDNNCTLDTLFFQQIDFIKIDIASYEVK